MSNLELAAAKFEELEQAISEKFQLDGEYKVEASKLNQRILKLKGELGMAFAVAKTKNKAAEGRAQ